MARGHKTGGRKAGTPNKRTQALKEKIEAYRAENHLSEKSTDPILVMMDIMAKEEDVQLRLAAAKELASYLYPKRKAVAIEEMPDTPPREPVLAPEDIALLAEMGIRVKGRHESEEVESNVCYHPAAYSPLHHIEAAA